ncbi:MAG: ATP-binding protein [bacterium]
MLHSFRLKIGLLSLCLSGGLLLGFGVFAVSALNRVARERIDRELRALVDSQIRKPQPDDHWRRFDESLRSVYGEQAARQFLVSVARDSGATVYATAGWPAGLPGHPLPLPPEPAPDAGRRARQPEAGPRLPPPTGGPQDRAEPPPRMTVRGPAYTTVRAARGEWRVMTLANEEVSVTLAMDLAGLHAEIGRFQRALLVAAPLGLLLLVAGGWLVGHMALRPVNLIARTAESVTARRLDARIPDARADTEFRHLIVLINGMLERLERSFQQATRFSADAAHELKTPLAILQAQVERSLQHATDGSAEQRECAEQLDEVQRLKAILRKLLLLSQADAGQLPLSLETVDLVSRVRTLLEDIQMLAPGRKTTLRAPADLSVTADADLLNLAIENLISNAIKFGDAAGPVAIDLARRDGRVVLSVSNTGTPIPAADHERIFARFYRADKSRSRKIEGAGLGLSLAREIARAHGGDLVLTRSDEGGTTFALSLGDCRN